MIAVRIGTPRARTKDRAGAIALTVRDADERAVRAAALRLAGDDVVAHGVTPQDMERALAAEAIDRG